MNQQERVARLEANQGNIIKHVDGLMQSVKDISQQLESHIKIELDWKTSIISEVTQIKWSIIGAAATFALLTGTPAVLNAVKALVGN